MIQLPKGLKEIGDEAFSGCTSLDGDLIAPHGLEKIGRGAFAGCWGIDKARMTDPFEDAESPDTGTEITGV